ncbi:archaetidylserine decarboxylase [Paenalcaligenes niemegkensis]|uniref:archaetidylserine decarboxylase n=1 Tax=Paenalcaligenes niemegkensis TaxID=2895469 RepID=UPI001EE7F7D1|nr:archaetidylserine decarboxylase [Paenalcaligenes niemegkensis]MCQ9617841.1 archaetidylserine decarboxylase [Paenalcaligenes niemegkensis]
MFNRLAVLPQYLFPKRLLTEFAGKVASHKGGAWTTKIIMRFIRRYNVDMSEAQNSDPTAYASFNEFFTRPLKEGARPISEADLVSPVDGAISQLGAIKTHQIFQAKGHDYSTQTLVGGDAALAAKFRDGLYATLYLSPRDYHRVHMPCDGRLLRMIYVPGDLFSVNPTTARGVPGLFARNERVVCVFDSERGPFVMALVGATIVGSMETVWHGQVNPPRAKEIVEWSYDDQAICLKKGEEMGRFLLGSTVVLLFPQDSYRFNLAWSATGSIKMGETMGETL